MIEVVASTLRFLPLSQILVLHVVPGTPRRVWGKGGNFPTRLRQYSQLNLGHHPLGCNRRKCNFLRIYSNVYFHFCVCMLADLGHRRHPPSALNCLFPYNDQHPVRTIALLNACKEMFP